MSNTLNTLEALHTNIRAMTLVNRYLMTISVHLVQATDLALYARLTGYTVEETLQAWARISKIQRMFVTSVTDEQALLVV